MKLSHPSKKEISDWTTNIELSESNIKVGDMLHVAISAKLSDVWLFHFDIWKGMQLTPNTEYMMMSSAVSPSDFYNDSNGDRPTGVDGMLLFKTQDGLNKFNAWLVSYSDRFDGDITTFLPTVKNGAKYDGYVLCHQNSTKNQHDNSSPEDFASEWLWILQHITGKVYWTPAFWLFNNADDLVLFRLGYQHDTADDISY